ncbi:hypothetical protein ACE3NQ_11115 [Paenibacillus terreus]|uniref:Uncharacterized protein n=1 Tax=Paenibacillus terreus TaxID=1387834 RepID=A0ABV5B7J3_9BACL
MIPLPKRNLFICAALFALLILFGALLNYRMQAHLAKSNSTITDHYEIKSTPDGNAVPSSPAHFRPREYIKIRRMSEE